MKTSQAEKDVWGHFNPAMRDAYLVNLNGIGHRSFAGYVGRIKDHVTDKTMNVEEKGVNLLKNVKSYHRFLMTVNVKDGMAIPTEDDERRYFIIRCSDELCAGTPENKAYFTKMDALVDDPVFQRDFYDFLMDRTVESHLGKFDIEAAMTQHHRELNEHNRDPIELWLADFIARQAADAMTIFVLTDPLYLDFQTFCEGASISPILPKPSFGTQLGQKKIDGVTTDKAKAYDNAPTGQRGWRFNLTTLRVGKLGPQDDVGAQPEAQEPDYRAQAVAFFTKAYP